VVFVIVAFIVCDFAAMRVEMTRESREAEKQASLILKMEKNLLWQGSPIHPASSFLFESHRPYQINRQHVVGIS